MNKTYWRLPIVATLALSALSLTACNGGGGGGGGGGGTPVVTQAWYNVYGQYCGASLAPGCDFYSDGTKITYNQSPLYAPLEYNTWYYTDVFGYSQTYTGWGRLTSDGLLYDDTGRALNANQSHNRDTITNAAAARRATIRGAANALAAKYGLEASTAMNVATALNDWALIGKSRKRTADDVAAFTKRLTGLNIGEVDAAMEAAAKGDASAVDQAVEKAARNWSTSPDTMKQILRDWFQAQGN
jgi:hypothetical protein